MKHLLVVGPAPCWVSDLLRVDWRYDYDVMLINRAGLTFTGKSKWWATYHSETMVNEGWNKQRGMIFGDFPVLISDLRIKDEATILFTHDGPSGSSTLLGVMAGLWLGYEKIVIIGAPMVDDKYVQYRDGWRKQFGALRGKVSSCSGWTKEFLESIR